MGSFIRWTASALLLFLALSCGPHPPRENLAVLHAPQTLRGERQALRAVLIDSTIVRTLGLGLSGATEKEWEGTFYTMEFVRYRSEAARQAVWEAFSGLESRGLPFQRALLEVAYTLYPTDFNHEIRSLLRSTGSEKLFAMTSLYLGRSDREFTPQLLSEILRTRFPRWSEHPILTMLDLNLREYGKPLRTPPMVDLLSHEFEGQRPVIFSIQRRDRRYPGIAVVRDAGGKFVREHDGTFLCASQLALSLSNLPGYLTFGNTPQGILSFQGFDVSDNRAIGPTTNIQLVLPWEADVRTYFHGASADTAWSEELYRVMLPDSWRSYQPIFEAYLAGKAGRTEIIAHGTTVDPHYYEGEIFYPGTPSLGCLTAQELWSDETGQNIQSEQLKLVTAMQRIGFERGFCVVVEVNDDAAPVTPRDVSGYLEQAERTAAARK